MQNEIRRELILPADPQTVWNKAFATAEALLTWFPEDLTGTFEIGQTFQMIWDQHNCECRLIEYNAPYSLAYQWHPGDSVPLNHHPESELTTVTFTLEPHLEGTKLTMVETGFANIPVSRHERVLGENEGGWTSELNELKTTYGN